MTSEQYPDTLTRFGFLLVSKYSMIAISSAIEPLRMANRLLGKNLFTWTIITADGSPEPASNDLMLAADCGFNNIPELDIVFVCSGVDVNGVFNADIQKILHNLARKKVILGGLCTGTYLLARSGLMDGYRGTVHWENIASMREEFQQMQISDELYEMDRDRFTCAGGSAPMDMMLKLIADSQGSKLSANISEQFMCDRIRGRHDRQRTPLQAHLGSGQPKLIEAVTLMEANIEEPMSVDELAKLVGISRRQLERLFQKHLNCVPTRYYMDLRLNCARRLLLQTDKSIVDVSLACGFVSAPHFSKCYRDFFGIPPRGERHLKQASNNK